MVTYAEGENLAREFKISFFETSALNNTNVDAAFMSLVGDIKVRLECEPKPVKVRLYTCILLRYIRIYTCRICSK